jgi:hypothetical protein
MHGLGAQAPQSLHRDHHIMARDSS